MEELKDAPLLSKLSMELFYGYYAPKDPASPEVSPLLYKDFSNLAPAYIQVAGMDPLRDEGIAYANKLMDAGYDIDTWCFQNCGLIIEKHSYQTRYISRPASCVWILPRLGFLKEAFT
jgi:acetyl esterase